MTLELHHVLDELGEWLLEGQRQDGALSPELFGIEEAPLEVVPLLVEDLDRAVAKHEVEVESHVVQGHDSLALALVAVHFLEDLPDWLQQETLTYRGLSHRRSNLVLAASEAVLDDSEGRELPRNSIRLGARDLVCGNLS